MQARLARKALGVSLIEGAKSPAFPFTGTRDDSPFPFRSRSGLPKPYFFFMGKHILLNVPLSRLWSICAFLALSLAFREFLDHLRSCYASGQGRERELWHAKQRRTNYLIY